MEARLTRALARVFSILGLIAGNASLAIAAAPKGHVAFNRIVEEAKADMLADPARAIVRSGPALRLAQAESDPDQQALMKARVAWLRAEAETRMGEPARALPLLAAANAQVMRRQPGSRLAADILLAQGSALTDTGQVTQALVTLQRAHALYLGLGDARSRAKALILIAMLYDGGRDHRSALRYFDQAADAHADDPALAMAIDNGRGIALVALQSYGDAEAAFIRALPIAHALRSDAMRATLLANIIDVRLREGRVDAAARTAAEGLALTERPSAAAIRPAMLAFSASVALRRGDFPRAQALIAERFRGVDLRTTILTDRDAHETAYRLALARGDKAEALAHLTALKRLDDQATEIARSNSAALAAARFDYTNQELRIAKLKASDLQKTVAFERRAARTQRLIFVGAGAATLLIMALLATGIVILRRSRDKVRAANAELGITNVALTKALAAKTEFLATTSHEIRTPLNGILGMTQVMIADPKLDAPTRDRLAVVHGAGVTMRALVDDILDVAKIETGKMTIEMTPMDLCATVDDAARLWRDQANGKGLAFTVDLEDCPGWIVGDAARLRQIVFNLLSNAVKFTAAGHVALRAVAADGRLRLTVEDTGIGIAPEVHETIFESFRQADAGTTRQFGGTGLGLSICRNLARAMGGDVTVASSLGAGATFTLDLPFEAALAPAAPATSVALLVVERSPINRAMFKTLFAPLGEIAFAGDAGEAADWLATHRAERVLVDAGTLGEDAPAAGLSGIVAAASDAHVALLSPACDGETRARWTATGIDRLIERPVSKKDLLSQVSNTLPALVPEAA